MDATRDVPAEILRAVLEDAHWAPTHGLTQPWRFHVFTGASRGVLADALQLLYDRVTPTGARNEDKRAKLGASPRLAPVVIAVAAKVEPGGKIPEIEEIAATSCAVQNLMLSARENGLGTFWSTPPVTLSAEFAEWLGLDANHRMLGLVFLGYPAGDIWPEPTPRRELEHHVVMHA